MNRLRYIGVFILILFGSLVHAQLALDTVCINGGPSHLATAYQQGLSYQWTVNGGQIIGRSDTNDIEVNWSNQPGLYHATLVVSDVRECFSDTASVWIYLRGPQVANAKGPQIVCRGSTVTLVSVISDFEWEGGSSQPTLSFVADKDTTIMLIALNGDCGNDTLFHEISTVEVPSGSISQIADTLQLNELRRLYYLGHATDYIDWYLNGQHASSTNSILINFDRTGPFEIMQVVTNGTNCSDTLKKTVYVEADFTVFIPNAFTPNGDGVNDYWSFDGVGIVRFTAHIYNRWGERIHTFTEQSPHGWDGKSTSGKDSKMDSYTYDIIIESVTGKTVHKKGYFSLVR